MTAVPLNPDLLAVRLSKQRVAPVFDLYKGQRYEEKLIRRSVLLFFKAFLHTHCC